jgi:hypothetical protein
MKKNYVHDKSLSNLWKGNKNNQKSNQIEEESLNIGLVVQNKEENIKF